MFISNHPPKISFILPFKSHHNIYFATIFVTLIIIINCFQITLRKSKLLPIFTIHVICLSFELARLHFFATATPIKVSFTIANSFIFERCITIAIAVS